MGIGAAGHLPPAIEGHECPGRDLIWRAKVGLRTKRPQMRSENLRSGPAGAGDLLWHAIGGSDSGWAGEAGQGTRVWAGEVTRDGCRSAGSWPTAGHDGVDVAWRSGDGIAAAV